MEQRDAITALAALAQDTRLSVFRLLVRKGPNGQTAGAIAEALDVPQSTLSFHLSQLERAGLVRATRQSRNIVYAVQFDGIRGLLTFLTDDCCDGRPELCGSAFEKPVAAAEV